MVKKREKQLKIKLSICMMVKNEMENLERCLKSFESILKRKDVELIIVDTGSTDDTVSIAQLFTQKVYFHKWDNDFSKMRNITISYAKGEWIFILDADEELVDCEKLNSLLDDTSINKFNTIQVMYRHFLSKKTERMLIQPSFRMFKNDGTFQYRGSVHNQPVFKSPILESDIYFNHYGYDNDNAELMEKKFKRTSSLLLSELTKDSDNIYYHYQLARTYLMHKDYEDALNSIRISFSLIKKSEGKINDYQNIFVNYAHIARVAGKPYEVVEVSKKGIEIFPQQIDLYFLLAIAYASIANSEQAIDAFLKYLELYSMKDKLPVFKDPSMEVNYCDEVSKTLAINNLSELYFEKNEIDKVLFYQEKLEDDKKSMSIFVLSLIKKKKFNQLANKYRNLANKDIKLVIADSIESKLNCLDDNEKEELSSVFSKIDDSYGKLHVIRNTSDANQLKELVKSFFELENFEYLPLYYSHIFIQMEIYNLSYFNEWKKLKSNRIKLIVSYLYDKPLMKESLLDFLISIQIRSNDFQSNRVFVAIASIVLLKELEETKEKQEQIDIRVMNIFYRYIEKGVSYFTELYISEKIRLIYKTLNDSEHQLFAIMYLIQEALKKENIKGALQLYKEAVSAYPLIAFYLEQNIYKLYMDIAKIYKSKGKYEEAIEMYEEALLRTENVENHREIIKLITEISNTNIALNY